MDRVDYLQRRTFFGGTIARADLGAMETWAFASFSPFMDRRRALKTRIVSVCMFLDICKSGIKSREQIEK